MSSTYSPMDTFDRKNVSGFPKSLHASDYPHLAEYLDVLRSLAVKSENDLLNQIAKTRELKQEIDALLDTVRGQ